MKIGHPEFLDLLPNPPRVFVPTVQKNQRLVPRLKRAP